MYVVLTAPFFQDLILETTGTGGARKQSSFDLVVIFPSLRILFRSRFRYTSLLPRSQYYTKYYSKTCTFFSHKFFLHIPPSLSHRKLLFSPKNFTFFAPQYHIRAFVGSCKNSKAKKLITKSWHHKNTRKSTSQDLRSSGAMYRGGAQTARERELIFEVNLVLGVLACLRV